MVAQFADVCAQGSYSTMGILFACVPRAKFSNRERRHSSSAVLPDCCVESHDVTETPCVLQRSLHVLCVHHQHLMEVSELIRQRNHRNMQ